MVVSKDSKRKRKESPLVESSPEMPKRTKVQAQRKFAQGQSAPSSSFNPSLTSSSTLNAGNSTLGNSSVSENREPPTEILPNKKPKTEDFLTFLCFRGTTALPPHLDFLNQQSQKDKCRETSNEEKNSDNDSRTIFQKSTRLTNNTNQKCSNEIVAQNIAIKPRSMLKQTERDNNGNGTIMAKKVSEREESDTLKLDKSKERLNQEVKRRSVRNKQLTNDFRLNSEAAKNDPAETGQQNLEIQRHKNIAKRQKNSSTKKSNAIITNIDQSDENDISLQKFSSTIGRRTIKKRRQKEAPIFVPSPEPMGRMTRQRAFFEPVKIIHNIEDKHNELKKNEHPCINIHANNEENTFSKDVFDFSSEDEQPLAKSIKIKTKQSSSIVKDPKALNKVKTSVKKKIDLLKPIQQDSDAIISSALTDCHGKDKSKKTPGRKPKKKTINEQNMLTTKNCEESGRSSLNDKRKINSNDNEVVSASLRQTFPSKKKKKVTKISDESEIRVRPTRKTKEAAAIYMGIIGQKLQLNEFDDDELSLNSFPDLPNVKEIEKIETELKKKSNLNKIITQTSKETKQLKIVTKPIMRRGRPPKSSKYTGKSIKIKKNTKQLAETLLLNESKLDNKIYKEDDEDFLLNEEVNETKRKLEKSFNDSDDEPLAIKLTKNSEKDSDYSKKSDNPGIIVYRTEKHVEEYKLFPKSLTFLPPTQSISTQCAASNPLNPSHTSKLDDQPKVLSTITSSMYAPRQLSIKNTPPQSPIPSITPSIRFQTPPTTYPPPIEAYPSPKINPNFLTPKFDRNLDRRALCHDNTIAQTNLQKSNFSSPSPVKFDITTAKITNVKNSLITSTSFNTIPHDPLKDEIGNILAANLMPSKEESGKIFGIASVSLAQSSGPDNTKCTLGKCGSIHKPVLGPVVPTESYLGEQLSSKERRKAKVNMTHEQIQKWLIECSSNPDEIQDDLDDDFEDNLRPNIYTTTPPPVRDDKESTSFSSSSKATRDLGKSESAWSGKGPSLKATPVVLPKDDHEHDEISSDIGNKECFQGHQPTKSLLGIQRADSFRKSKERLKDDNDKQEIMLKKNIEKCLKTTGSQKGVKLLNARLSSKLVLSSQCQQKQTEEPKNEIILSQTSKLRTRTPVNIEKNCKKALVYDAKLREPISSCQLKKTSMSYTFEAFSPDNEKSIYSFDKEENETKICLSNPFKRHSRQESNAEETIQSSSQKPTEDNLLQSGVSVALSTVENSKLAKVGTESRQIKQLKCAEKLNEFSLGDLDSDIHTFYIPLQSTVVEGSAEKNSDLIQGVAVKLGREGPEGPNQKVVMHATLVTKSQMGSNSKPLPEFMNVSEIVKTLLNNSNTNKDPIAPTTTQVTAAPMIIGNSQQNLASSVAMSSCKSVPIGTVQPRFKSTESVTVQSNPSGSGAAGQSLIRVNSNSSLFSGSNKSRNQSNKKKDDAPIKMCNNTAFPRHDDPTQMVEAPIFRPSEKEFVDPMEFIDKITPIAARFGICKIIPPPSFKPECRVSDDMRFTAYNQYVHKMLHRWGPNAKELSAIKKYLSTQNIVMNHPPWIGGMEVDLPRLYHTVQELGGLKEVIEKKKWVRVAEEMCIPKLAQDRVTKLDDIYCKYLLPYDTLSPIERQKLFDEVEAEWTKREGRARRNIDRFANTESMSNEDCDMSSEEDEDSEEEPDSVSMECIVKGRSMPLSQFYRIARNTMSLWFKNTEPSVNEVEAEFWRHVAVRDNHVCVHSGSIDSSGWGYGFPSPGPKGKGSACARHPWNLKVLTNNSGSVLRSLGPVMGVTVPTLHVGMLFSACCWYRDPHGLSWIEYLHTGASKLWYGIPDDQSANFRAALTSLIPTHCQNKTIWLPCDTVMVPPHMLTDRGVSLCRIEQKPGEFVVIFPRAYTSSVSTGYVISESVYFATSSWLELGKDDFRDIHDSCEPAMFSLEQLLFALASDQRVAGDILYQTLPMINEVFEKETAAREQLKAAGVVATEKVIIEKTSRSKKTLISSAQHECDVCRANLYISMIRTDEGSIFCLQHALKNLNKGNISAKQCKLIFSYNIEDIENIIKNLKERLIQKRVVYKKAK